MDNGDNWRLLVDFVEYYALGAIGVADKFDAHALKSEPDLLKIATPVGRNPILCLVASKSALIDAYKSLKIK